MPEAFTFLSIRRNQLLVVSLVWIILVILINPYGEFPFNDDWAYAQSVKALVETRTFFMSAYVSTNLLAQIGWGTLFCLPFGFSFTAVRLSTLVAGLFGLWGTHRLIYASTESKSTALTGTLLVLANPMFVGLSASFMSDVPFYALMVWALAFLVTGLKQDSLRAIAIGLGLAIVALLIRQFGIAIFVGFGVAYIARKGISVKSVGVAVLSVGLGLVTQMIYQRWLHYMIPIDVHYNVQATNFFKRSFYQWKLVHDFSSNTFITLMYMGVFIFPYFLTLINKNSLTAFRQTIWLWVLLTGIVLGAWYYFFDWAMMPFWFNTVNAFGIGPFLLRDLYFNLYRLPMPGFLHILMGCLTIGSVIGSVCILFYSIELIKYVLRRPTNKTHWAIVLFLLTVLVIYYFPIGMHIVFDRYLLPIPALLICLIHAVLSWSQKQEADFVLRWPAYASAGLLAVYLTISIGETHDYMAWNRVRWEALRGLMKQGIKPSEIDGGLEFNGWHQYDPLYKPTPDKSWWWIDKDTYVLAASVLPGYRPFQQHTVNTWFPWGIQTIHIGKKK